MTFSTVKIIFRHLLWSWQRKLVLTSWIRKLCTRPMTKDRNQQYLCPMQGQWIIAYISVNPCIKKLMNCSNPKCKKQVGKTLYLNVIHFNFTLSSSIIFWSQNFITFVSQIPRISDLLYIMIKELLIVLFAAALTLFYPFLISFTLPLSHTYIRFVLNQRGKYLTKSSVKSFQN